MPRQSRASPWVLVSAVLALAFTALPPAHAQKKVDDRADTFVYVSMAPEQKIRVYRLDPKEGKLTDVETVAVEGAPGALGVDPRKQFLIASLRSTSALGGSCGKPPEMAAERQAPGCSFAAEFSATEELRGRQHLAGC